MECDNTMAYKREQENRKMMFNGVGDQWQHMTREDIKELDREELVTWLEFRGFACYDDESTSLLRETAIEDFDGEHG